MSDRPNDWVTPSEEERLDDPFEESDSSSSAGETGQTTAGTSEGRSAQASAPEIYNTEGSSTSADTDGSEEGLGERFESFDATNNYDDTGDVDYFDTESSDSNLGTYLLIAFGVVWCLASVCGECI